MAESFVERRRRELAGSSSNDNSAQGIPDNLSFPERRRRELGLSNEKTPNMIHSDENAQYADMMKQAYQSNPGSFPQSHPAQDPNQPNARPDLPTDYPGGWLNPVNDLNALRKTKVGQFIDSFAQAAGRKMGLSADQMSSPASTGNKTADSIANFAGDVTGYVANPAQLEMSVGNTFFNNPIINKVAGKLGSLTDNALAKYTGAAVANTAEARLARGAVEGATKGALGSAAYAPFQTLEQGQDVQNIPGNTLTDTIAGGLLGGVFGGAGSLIKSGLGRMKPAEVAAPIEANVKPSIDPRLSKMDEILNIDSRQPDLIKLTPSEIAQRDRIDQFSQTTDNLGTLPDTASQIQSKTVKESIPLPQRANDAYIKGVDNLQRVNQFDKKVAEVTGELKPSESSYKLGLNSRGSDMISRQILEKNLVDSQGNVIGESLRAVSDKIPKGQQQVFEDYLVAKHSISRMGRGEKVYADSKEMTIQKAEAKVSAYEQSHPEFKDAAQSYYDYNQKLGQAWLVDTGLISQKQWDGYLAANPHYVPNQRIFSELEKSQQYGGKGGFSNQTAPVKKAEGSQRQIVSPIESTIENTAKYVKTAKQNEVMQALYSNIQKDPEAFKDWAEIVGTNSDDVSKILNEDGPEALLEEVAKSFDAALNKPDLTKGNIVSAFVNGERVHLRINDPQLLESLTNLSPQGQHFVMDAIGKVTKTMKVLTTGANPVFSLTRNIFRDVPTAFINSKSTNNPFVFGKDLLGAMVSVFKNGELYNSYKNIGGGHSSSVAADRNLLAQSKEKILPSTGLGQTLKRNLITKPYHAIENLNNALETAPRLGEFKRITKDGSYDSKVSGLYEANDVTTNFNKFGNNTKQADALFPYLNAAVQGLDKTVRVFKDNPKQALIKSAGAVTVPTVLLYALNHDNPDYQQVSNFVKDNNFLIPKGDGTFLKVPKPRELGMMFSSPLERVMNQWSQEDPRAWQDFAHNFIQNFAPPGIGGAVQGLEGKNKLTGVLTGPLQDTIGGPLISLLTNKDFANRPIVPGDLQKLSPELQSDSRTSEVANILGGITKNSPKQIDYLIKSYGGVLGQLGIPLTTKGGSLGDTLKQQVTVDPTFSNDISRNFYDAKDKADQAMADAKVTGIFPQQDLSGYYDRISTGLGKIRKQMKSIHSDSGLSKDEKKSKLQDLQRTMNTIQKQATK